MNRHYIALLVTVMTLVGCAVTGESGPTLVSQTSTPVAIDLPREIIGLSISLYLLVDDKEGPDPAISTHRTEADLREILEGMNDIWSQADARFDLQTIETVAVPEAILQGMQAGTRRASSTVGGASTPKPVRPTTRRSSRAVGPRPLTW